MKSNLGLATVVVAAACGIAATGAKPAYMSSHSLYDHCQHNDYRKRLVCVKYIESMAGALTAGNSINGFTACIPTGVQVGQINDVVRLLARHPERRHLSAEGPVAQALQEAFPCR